MAKHYRHVDFSTIEGRIALSDQIDADIANLNNLGQDTFNVRIQLRKPHTESTHKQARTFENKETWTMFLFGEDYNQKWNKIATKGYVLEIGVAIFRGKQFMGFKESYVYSQTEE